MSLATHSRSVTHNDKDPDSVGLSTGSLCLALLLVSALITLSELKCPRQDSNLRTRLRRPLLYPLSYGGVAAFGGDG